MTSSWRATLLAGVLYGAIAILWTFPLASRPSELAAIPYDQSEQSLHETRGGWGPIVRNDQLLSIALPARNAHSLLEARLTALIDNGLCFPLRNAGAFGEHMLEFSLLTLPAYALTGDPLLSYNFGCLLEVMLMGMTLFALLRHWTADSVASFLAGLLFVFHPWRTDLFAHPALVSLHWLPLVLLYFERLLQSPSLRAAMLLGLTAALQMLTASYLAITFALFAGVYGAIRVFRERRHLGRRALVLLVLSVAGAALVMTPVLLPYLDAQQTWLLVRSGASTMATPMGLLPGGAHANGTLALALASLALIRPGGLRSAPVGAILAASLVCFALSVRIPAMTSILGVDSPYEALRGLIPLLSMIRVPALLRVGGYLGIALLAGIGLARLLKLLEPRARRAAIVATSFVAAVELFHVPVTSLLYQATPRVVMRELRPSAGVLEAYAALDAEPVASPILDLPFEYRRVVKGAMASYVFWSAYHLQPTAACYNSFFGAAYQNVGRIAERYWNGGAPDELLALGLHNLAVHDPEAWIASVGARPRARMLAQTNDAIAVRLDGGVDTHDDVTRLRPGRIDLGYAVVPAAEPELSLQVTNDAERVWTLPRPPRPSRAQVTWTPKSDSMKPLELEASFLPPLALAGGRTDVVPIAVPKLPPPGEYRLTVAIADLQWTLDEDVVVPAPGGPRP